MQAYFPIKYDISGVYILYLYLNSDHVCHTSMFHDCTENTEESTLAATAVNNKISMNICISFRPPHMTVKCLLGIAYPHHCIFYI